jgi:hypothetical protein
MCDDVFDLGQDSVSNHWKHQRTMESYIYQ